MTLAFVGLGSNLGQPVQQVRSGVSELARLPHTRLLSCSSLYRSEPIGVPAGAPAQADFINAVCAIETEVESRELMRRLLDIERRNGRRREIGTGAARTLDLDLLLYGSETVAIPELTLPHPRMHERAFVLAPLVEIAPGIDIPGYGSATALLPACAGQRIERLQPADIEAVHL